MNLIDQCKQIIDRATPVENWYKRFHRGGDCYGPEDTLRGPFFSWIKFHEKVQAPEGAFADTKDDAEFIAFARTAMPELVRRLVALETFIITKIPCGCDVSFDCYRCEILKKVAKPIESPLQEKPIERGE